MEGIMSEVNITRISADEIDQYRDQQCPACHQGKLRCELDHDAVEGNATILRCDKRNPCRHTIEIVL